MKTKNSIAYTIGLVGAIIIVGWAIIQFTVAGVAGSYRYDSKGRGYDAVIEISMTGKVYHQQHGPLGSSTLINEGSASRSGDMLYITFPGMEKLPASLQNAFNYKISDDRESLLDPKNGKVIFKRTLAREHFPISNKPTVN
ncbi:hypothetical protein [Aquitalea aquatica]|uniref:Uncharacterized protein n=1 Tax=Aquitalea aquatica TaxID=3044273 RepID=A0A838YIZ9_9NEIS|nr:hypothetical protein [Aquitalea magnusonii]MBA4710551.1 hypothetical protein [Aquitalea magnusonii]